MSGRIKTSDTKEGAMPALAPKLRFPEFRGAEGWKVTQLQNIALPVSDRAATGDSGNVLSLSGEHGLVLQSDYFGKKVAGDNSERYIKLCRNDFVYNDRTTKASTFGTIKRLSNYEGGIVSPIYKCFRFHIGENPVFWEWYFESGNHDSALRGLVNEGARAGRFNISISQFLSTAACQPDESEQQKIAECLSSVGELLAAQARKLDALKTHKHGLMRLLFPREGETHPRLRFPEFQSAGEWEARSFGNLCESISSGKDKAAADGAFDLYGSTGVIGKTCDRSYGGSYLLVARVGANAGFVTKATGEFGVTDNALVIILKAQQQIDFVRYYLDCIQLNKMVFGSGQPLITGGQIKALGLDMPPPAEQHRIATCLRGLDALIAAETKKLEVLLKIHKKGLMQQLFASPEATRVRQLIA
jgi:type I restriction enzyme S subunit